MISLGLTDTVTSPKFWLVPGYEIWGSRSGLPGGDALLLRLTSVRLGELLNFEVLSARLKDVECQIRQHHKTATVLLERQGIFRDEVS